MPLLWQTVMPDTRGAYRDPYLRWAEATGWRAFRGQEGWDRQSADDAMVQIIARIDDPCDLPATAARLGLTVPAVYRSPVPGTDRLARHFTAWVPRHRLADLPCDEGFRWRLSQPMRDAERMARGSTLGRYGAERAFTEFRARNLLGEVVDAARRAPAAPRPDRVIAVIDYGCPILNPAFAQPGRPGETRLAAVWDQGSAPPRDGEPHAATLPWQAAADLGYGREIPAAVLAGMARAVHGAAGPLRAVDEAALYRGIDHLIDYDDPRRRVWYATHGAHVLDVAGGAVDPFDGAIDAAGNAALIFVQLPSMTAADSSGASLAGHLLDGVRYVLARAAEDARIVVNISYGSRAGPQDGSTLIEAALDELLELRPTNFAIVVSAGNARRQRAHVRRIVVPERSAMLRCQLAAGDTTDTFVEAWYHPPPQGWRIEARARAVGGAWSDWLPPAATAGRGSAALLTPGAGHRVAMLRHDRAVPNGGDGLSLVLLAVAPTREPRGLPMPVAPAGPWDVELRLVAEDATPASRPEVEVRAQIERDDPGQNDDAGASVFRDPDAFDDRQTLGSLAWGRHTVVAGGFRLADRRAVDYGSVGTRASSMLPPLVLAACERSADEPYLLAAAVRAEDRFRMNGTSVAAPVLARQLFNAMFDARGRPRRIERGHWGAVIEALASEPDGRVRLPGPGD